MAEQNNHKPQGLTLREFARAIDLSPTTVSRALNGYSDVNEQTRQRVIDAATAMGYTPNRSAQRLAKGVVGAIGLLVNNQTSLPLDTHQSAFIAGAMQQAQVDDIDLVLKALPLKGAINQLKRYLAKRSVDGFIVTSALLGDDRVALLNQANIPFIVYGRNAHHEGYSWLDYDHFQISFDVTAFLLHRGHRRLGLLGYPRTSRMFRDRYEGVVAAFYEYGLPSSEPKAESHTGLRFFDGQMTADEGFKIGLKWLELDPLLRPTAVVCANMAVAMGFYKAIHRLQLSVPKEISLVV